MKEGSFNYFSGTSGLVVPIAKKLYPEASQGKSRLAYYASLYNSIEINSIFYKLPKPSTVEKWVNEVPGGFRFTFKLSKSITHVKGLNFQLADLDLFMKTIFPAVNKKGCLLMQFPPGLKFEMIAQLRNLLKRMYDCNNEQGWPLAIEFRNQTWDHPEVTELLERYNVTQVIHDLKGSASLSHSGAANIKYLRFHGPEGNYRGSYTDEVLSGYAEHIKQWIKEKQRVFVYFNNTMGEATANLQKLNQMVHKSIK